MSDKENEKAAHGSTPHEEGGHGHHGEAVYPYTPHHFHAAKQHFDSGKLGVWLFLVTEILFFSGLFCAYIIYRAQHPEVFYWAHFYLDTTMGAVNTVVLIVSSFTAAWAVRNAQLGEKGLLRANILVTIVCAFVFMGIKAVEYNHKFHDGLYPSGHFDPKHEVWETPSFKKQHPASAEAAVRIVEGLEARKAAQVATRDEIVGERDALSLVAVADDKIAASAPTQKAVEPGQPALEQGTMVGLLKADLPVAEPVKTVPAAESKTVEPLSDDAWLLRQVKALSEDERRPLQRAGIIRSTTDGPLEFARPEKAGVFFSIYFFMTGLHGFHVVIGIGLWIWMLAIAGRRQMGKKYFGPVEFTALYWHLVDLIWIYLFPMLYLIH